MQKSIVITLDFGKIPEWAVRAKMRQLEDWLKVNKGKLPFDDLIIIPAPGDTKLYWLEGKIGDPKDIAEIERIRNEMKPILEIALEVKPNIVGYIDPLKQAVQDLAAYRRAKR